MKFTTAVALACCLCSLPGCSGSQATVSGTVTLDGKPLERGGVNFIFDGNGPTAVGTIEADGRYRVMVGSSDRLPPGRYFVTVVSYAEIKPVKPGEAPAAPPLITPPNYRDKEKSGLKFELKPGSNRIDLPLTSK